MKTIIPRSLFVCLFAALAIATQTGCVPEDAKGTVAGSVKLMGGAPVTQGTVNFYSKERGIGSVGTLDEQGGFKLADPLPAGTYSVFIPPPLPAPPMPGVVTRPPGTFTVPKKYHTEVTSDLKENVKPGVNTVVIELK